MPGCNPLPGQCYSRAFADRRKVETSMFGIASPEPVGSEQTQVDPLLGPRSSGWSRTDRRQMEQNSWVNDLTFPFNLLSAAPLNLEYYIKINYFSKKCYCFEQLFTAGLCQPRQPRRDNAHS